jgi:hypothetical protein
MEQVKRALILNPQRMRLAEYERQDWIVNAEEGTTPDDLKDPGYWAHMSAQLKPYDHIEVRIDNGEWVAELLVLSCDRNWAKVYPLSFHDLRKAGDVEVASEKYEVAFKGPQFKWSVIRMSDGEKLKTGCADKAEAASWLREHEKIAA